MQLSEAGAARKAFGETIDELAQRSLSALTLSIHAPTSGFPLTYHNLFFNQHYASEFEDIFTRHTLPRRPTVYVCAQDRREQIGERNHEQSRDGKAQHEPLAASRLAPARGP